jgi:hypothetical protein
MMAAAMTRSEKNRPDQVRDSRSGRENGRKKEIREDDIFGRTGSSCIFGGALAATR